jgi:hypothetical protein
MIQLAVKDEGICDNYLRKDRDVVERSEGNNLVRTVRYGGIYRDVVIHYWSLKERRGAATTSWLYIAGVWQDSAATYELMRRMGC